MNQSACDTTDGLASGYQRTEITGAGYAAVTDTSGALVASVRTLPFWIPVSIGRRANDECLRGQDVLSVNRLAADMVSSADFRAMTERGMADLDRGRQARLEDVKRRLGDI